MREFDAIVIGGGPAGSTAARFLGRGGRKVAVIDRATFPRVKLCAGWLSAPVWDALAISPDEYPRGLWKWRRCHVAFAGEQFTVRAQGYFIRRYELDDYLLSQSGAEVISGHNVREVARKDGKWIIDGELCAPVVIGAGGTHCPVARLFPKKPERPVGVKEHEFAADPRGVAETRVGEDGEPELLLHDDLAGYSWNVPKTDWLNIGTGTANARAVTAAWAAARAHFEQTGHVPQEASPALDHMKGHSYYLFDPAHLDGCHRDGAYLIGDSLGLAHPLTAEGIFPAILSGRLCAEAILADRPEAYRRRLANHPAIRDYKLIFEARNFFAARTGKPANGEVEKSPSAVRWPRLGKRAVATGFAWMFSGRPVPGGDVLRLATAGARSARMVWDRERPGKGSIAG